MGVLAIYTRGPCFWDLPMEIVAKRNGTKPSVVNRCQACLHLAHDTPQTT